MGGTASEPPSARNDRALTARALAWLAQREHSRLELRRKLLSHALEQAESDTEAVPPVPPGGAMRPTAQTVTAAPDKADAVARVEAVLDWLEAHGHLSQQRFVELRVRARAQRYGNLRIRQELAQHGVALPAQAETALRASELDRARAVWERKFGRAPARGAEGPAAAAKQVRFLACRGFSGEVIRRVLREAGERPAPTPDATDPPVQPTAQAPKAGTGSHLRLISKLRKPPASG